MATLRMQAGASHLEVLGSHLEKHELERAAKLLPEEWCITTVGSSGTGLTVTVQTPIGATIKTFPPGSLSAVMEFLDSVRHEYGGGRLATCQGG